MFSNKTVKILYTWKWEEK